MPKALLLWLALWLVACAVPAPPLRQTLRGLPARFVALPLDLGNGDEVTVHGESSLYVTNFTLFFRTFCDTLVEVSGPLCGPRRGLPRPWAIYVLEKDFNTALVGYPDRASQEATAGAAVIVSLRAYRLAEPVDAVLITSKRAAREVATALCAQHAVTEREAGGVMAP